MATSYFPVNGAPLNIAKANQYGNWIAKMKVQHGPQDLANKMVLDAAKKNSPGHDFFDWDNSIAGDKWRLQQARNLICWIGVKVEDPDDNQKTMVIRIWHPVENPTTGKNETLDNSEIAADPVALAGVCDFIRFRLKEDRKRLAAYLALAPQRKNVASAMSHMNDAATALSQVAP